MLEMTDEQFSALISEAMDSISPEHMAAVKNVAIVYADEPTPEQREKLRLRGNETLLGLYEGVPLPQRGGMTHYGPDKITLFKVPILMHAVTTGEVKEEIRHTLWHELAHYFGLDHPAIYDLEK